MAPALMGAMLVLGSCGTPEQRLADRALRLGARHYFDSAFVRADSAFAIAPHDARAVYDRGMAAQASFAFGDAASHFEQAAAMDTTALRPLALYNLGHARLDEARDADTTIARIQHNLGRTAPATDDITDRVSAFVLTDSLSREATRLEGRIDSALVGAINGFKACLRLTPADEDARHNLVLAQSIWAKRQKERSDRSKDGDKDKDKALTEKAKLLLQQADELVDQYRFKDALQLLQGGLKQEPSLSNKKEYMDKLDLVTKAAEAS
ncbi:MAG: hypothetical protein IPM46_15000 [Flavobacteriales bacterium]|nr:hypothetical protein [Flavobacteriales bacterium]